MPREPIRNDQIYAAESKAVLPRVDMTDVKHVSMFSGGVCSWCATERMIAGANGEPCKFVFADTIIEDDDLYRFVIESAAHFSGSSERIGCLTLPPIEDMPARKAALEKLRNETRAKYPILDWIADGRTPWELAFEHKVIPRSGLDVCSRVLKREFIDKHIKANYPDAIVYIGVDWTEAHRLEGCKKRNPSTEWRAPMTEAPYLQKDQMLAKVEGVGIRRPRLYSLGFPHNNCGGFCFKSGISNMAHLYRTLPTRFAYHEEKENGIREIVGDHSIMKDRTGGTNKRLTMTQLREKIERQEEFDQFDWSGCGCALG